MRPSERSRQLAHALRHAPAEYGLSLDPAGWVTVERVLAAFAWSREELDSAVNSGQKRRFEVCDGRIRAVHGHSIDVDAPPAAPPPEILFHGTVADVLPAIRRDGLRPMSRAFVHLSVDEAGARSVASRHGEPVLLRVAAEAMHAAGHTFHPSASGVWLVASVPPEFLLFP